MTSNSSLPMISIVTPCYNEEGNVLNHFARVREAIKAFDAKYRFEFIYTDNCSADRTFEILKTLGDKHENVRAMRFSRNIGSTRAMMIGLSHARGDAAILIQADLQDPPELIPDFIRGWEEGYDVVYGKILRRNQESALLQTGRKIYYRIVARLADIHVPESAGDFRLTSRRVLDSLKQYDEEDLYLRGVIAHIGFKQKPIPYERAPRVAGESNAPFFYLVGFALNGIVSSTVVPIRMVSIAGFATSGFGLLAILYFVLAKFLFPEYVPQGLTTLAFLIVFFAGVQMLAIGVIGEYIRKIYVQSLHRPKGFVQDKVNLG